MAQFAGEGDKLPNSKATREAIEISHRVYCQERRLHSKCSGPKRKRNANEKWVEDGVVKRSRSQTFAENPTLTVADRVARYAPYSYQVQTDLVPFAGWDYLEVKKFKSSNCLVTMYGEYIECILRNFMAKLSKQQVSFQIALCDCMDIKQHLEEETVYDRILTSNLMDYLFLPN